MLFGAPLTDASWSQPPKGHYASWGLPEHSSTLATPLSSQHSPWQGGTEEHHRVGCVISTPRSASSVPGNPQPIVLQEQGKGP